MSSTPPAAARALPALRPREWSGPAITLAIVALVHALRSTPVRLPDPGVLLVLAIAWSSYAGGAAMGIASAALALAYEAWWARTGAAPAPNDGLRHLVVFAVAAPVLVIAMAHVRRRARRVVQAAADAAAAGQYRQVFEEAGDPIFVTDAALRFVFVNKQACALSGYTREELIGRPLPELIAPADLAAQPLRLEEIRRARSVRLERDMLTRDGRTLRIEATIRALDDGGLLAVARDVTEQRDATERLRRALSLVQATLESTADGILVVDDSGRWRAWNGKFLELWRLDPALAESGDDAAALAHVGGQLADPDAFVARVRAIYADPQLECSDELRFADGRVYTRFSIPQRLGGRVVGRVWSFRDATAERRQAVVLRETQERFLQAEKLEAVGRLAGGVAHDFNNMLTAILGEADLLLLAHALDEGVRQPIEHIRDAALRSTRLTRQLLTFARRQHTEERALDLAALVRGLDALVRRLAGRNADVRLDVPGEEAAPWVRADPSQLEQAILNLVINAGDAMPAGGLLAVRVGRREVAASEVGLHGAQRPGPHAFVEVVDTGTGIPPEVRPHLFEPFYTTKPRGKGTGLGLAAVHGIVQQAEGFVEVDSRPGQGSTFRILLPECAAPDANLPASASAWLGRARILVVDDEAHVRRFVSALLASAGYDVHVADGPAQARTLAVEGPAPFDLLLTDVVMPGEDGPTLARALRAAGRVREVIFMSGWLDGAPLDAGAAGTAAFVHKPFRSDELLDRVRSLLETHGEA